jgi:hypothetical protein
VLRLLALFTAIVPSPAAADAVPPPPDSCTPGSEAVFCHGPQTCRADECTSDLECAPTHHCEEAMLCVADHGCGRLGTPIYTHVAGECPSGTGCDVGLGESCRPLRVCRPGARVDAGDLDAGGTDGGGTDAPIDAPSDAGEPPLTRGGCCSAVDRRGPGGALTLLLVALFALARRR